MLCGEATVHAKYKCQCFPQFKNVSALRVGRRAGAEPPAERSAGPAPAVRRPATPRDAATRHRSRSAPPPKSPPTARHKAGETDIFKLDGTDICTLGLQ